VMPIAACTVDEMLEGMAVVLNGCEVKAGVRCSQPVDNKATELMNPFDCLLGR